MITRLFNYLILPLLPLLLLACSGATRLADTAATTSAPGAGTTVTASVTVTSLPPSPPAATVTTTSAVPATPTTTTRPAPADPALAAPTAVPVTDDNGATVATQDGPLWVLLSGVDEHGLLAEPALSLLAAPAPDAASAASVPTGAPAAVAEIRQAGPQGLRRFYRVQTVAGAQGWVSDFYVRRLGYLYDGNSDGVQLYLAPAQQPVAKVVNVTPVRLLDPTDSEWWLVETADRPLQGWVAAEIVMESPEPEFLVGGGQGEHEH